MQNIELEARIGPMARRAIVSNGGSMQPSRNTKRRVTFPAIKVWRFATNTDYLVGWNVLTHYKAKGILRCRHPRLLTIRQLNEIDNLILPRLKDDTDCSEVAETRTASSS